MVQGFKIGLTSTLEKDAVFYYHTFVKEIIRHSQHKEEEEEIVTSVENLIVSLLCLSFRLITSID